LKKKPWAGALVPAVERVSFAMKNGAVVSQ
jgi:parvulin-like peptidyl-prolyl isomerase